MNEADVRAIHMSVNGLILKVIESFSDVNAVGIDFI